MRAAYIPLPLPLLHAASLPASGARRSCEVVSVTFLGGGGCVALLRCCPLRLRLRRRLLDSIAHPPRDLRGAVCELQGALLEPIQRAGAPHRRTTHRILTHLTHSSSTQHSSNTQQRRGSRRDTGRGRGGEGAGEESGRHRSRGRQLRCSSACACEEERTGVRLVACSLSGAGSGVDLLLLLHAVSGLLRVSQCCVRGLVDLLHVRR